MATRGRPKGAKSFVNVDMETLSQYFGAKQHIPVSRVWLEKMVTETYTYGWINGNSR